MSHLPHLLGNVPRSHVTLGVSPVTRAPEMLLATCFTSHMYREMLSVARFSRVSASRDCMEMMSKCIVRLADSHSTIQLAHAASVRADALRPAPFQSLPARGIAAAFPTGPQRPSRVPARGQPQPPPNRVLKSQIMRKGGQGVNPKRVKGVYSPHFLPERRPTLPKQQLPPPHV